MDIIFRIFDEENNKLTNILSYKSNDIITPVAFSPDGSRIFRGEMKGKITKFILTEFFITIIFIIFIELQSRCTNYYNNHLEIRVGF